MLSIEHLYFSYQGQPPYVLNDLNLHIHSGDYISIVGDNGCGKSTLATPHFRIPYTCKRLYQTRYQTTFAMCLKRMISLMQASLLR